MPSEPAPTKLISMREVRRHDSSSSLWVVIYNSVYDVTSFLEEHPGGSDVLIENAGTDATIPFENVGHSKDARELLNKYKIGELIIEDAKHTIDYKKYIPHVLVGLAVAFIFGFGIRQWTH